MIVGLSGFAQSGKDTAADILVAEREYTKLSFAGALRDFVYATNPIIGIKATPGSLVRPFLVVRYADEIDRIGYEAVKAEYPEAREILQRIGTEAGRQIISDTIWVDAAFNNVLEGHNYVFQDVRFPNEAEAVRKRGGKVIRIERPGVSAVNAHESETAILDYRFDFIINNDSSVEVLKERLLGYLTP